MPAWLSSLGAKIVAIIALGILVVALAWLAISQWQHAHTAATESRLQHAQDEAVVNSAQDAIATQGAAAEHAQASEQLTRTNSEEIHNAEGAKVVVNSAVDAAGRRAICLRDAYRDTPKCKLLGAAPR